MCGIFGLLTPGTSVDLDACRRATSTLAHRGPDGAGFVAGALGHPSTAARLDVCDGGALASVESGRPTDWFLGHRRLAVLDLTHAASQPMANEDRSCWVTFNGEIYNHRELRRQLEHRGHRFATDHSDTEVLVHGYEEWGEGLLDRLRGMYAFGLVDVAKRRLLLARDCFGEKPLYFAADQRGVCFASEPRAIVAAGLVTTDVSRGALSDFLAFGYVPAPRSVFASIAKLGAAECAVFDLDAPAAPRVTRYWAPTYDPAPIPDERVWQEEFDAHLLDAVRARVESDVPIGAFLSGGLDSTAVTLNMSKTVSKLSAFTIGFDEAEFDEGRIAGTVAARLQVSHHLRRVGADDLLAAARSVADVFDEPFADASAIPTLALTRMAREHVTVALSGDGGDEMLGGYTRYGWNGRIGRLFGHPLAGVTAWCGSALGRAWPEQLRGRGLVDLLVPDPGVRYSRLIANQWLAGQSTLGASDLTAFHAAWDPSTPTLLNRMCRSDLQLYLPEDLMVKVDRTSMAVGLETRAPFLDRPLFEFLAKSPPATRSDRGIQKRPLRRQVQRAFGAEAAERPKQGFAVPLGRWFRHELRDIVGDTLGGRDGLVQELFPKGFALSLLDAHAAGSRDLSPRLWSLFVLQLWHDRFGRPAIGAA